MLAALDALIQNGTGGRRALALRQLCELFLKVSSTSEESTTTLFDEVMANIAADLDDETVVYLAPEMPQMSAILPAFASTVSSKGHEIALRPNLGESSDIKPPAEQTTLWVRDPLVMITPDAPPVALIEEQAPPVFSHTLFSESASFAEMADVPALSPDVASQEPIIKNEPIVKTESVATIESLAATEFSAATEHLAAIGSVKIEPSKEPRHGPAVGGAMEGFDVPQTASIVPPVLTERRAAPREPMADANNPITLARKAGVPELMQIAVLPNLPESLTNVLVARGERDVLEKVLQNKTATFSRSSLTTLSELAPSDRMIKDCLIARSDLPEPIIERLLPFLAPLAKAQLLYSDSPFGEYEARKALSQASADLVAAYRNGQMLLGLDTCLATVDDGKMTISETVILLARDIRVAELSAFMAAKLGICHVTAFNVLSSRLDHTSAVLVRALGCDMTALEAVMVMRGRCGCREARETKSARYTANKYTQEEATAMVARFDQIARTAIASNAATADGVQKTLTPDDMQFAA
jgi:Uncharacterised protein conserved in bacteria (DUF2336)